MALRALRLFGRWLALVLICGFLGATLVRFSPGFGVDEHDLDARLGQQEQARARAAYDQERNLGTYYISYLKAAAHGDFGVSHSLQQPVGVLVSQRWRETARSLAIGAGMGLAAGILLAVWSVYAAWKAFDAVLGTFGSATLSLPAGLIAIACLWLRAPAHWAIAVSVFPHVYRYARNIVGERYAAAHVFAARSAGLRESRILTSHVLWPALPELAALGAGAVNIAFGALVPIEFICDKPGLGQLACNAALARDLPLLVAVTMLATMLVVGANTVADLSLQLRVSEAA